MKNLYITASLFVFLIVFSAFVFLPKSAAQNNVLNDLLSLPAPPPPNPGFSGTTADANSRPPEFYSQKNPPDDNAPIDEIMDYWQAQNRYDPKRSYAVIPSERTLQRILEELDRHPEKLGNFLNVLSTRPDGAENVRRIYERMKAGGNNEEYALGAIEGWLTQNTTYNVEALAAAAAASKDQSDYVTNQDAVLALARVDWERARPILERMVNDPTQPVSQTLARWAFYEHAVREGNEIEADRWRDELKKTVENKSLKAPNRDLAMDAIVEVGDFPGRDDWYFQMLEDETLHDLGGYTGLTTMITHSPPDKYIEKMIELVRTGSPTVRAAAIRNLTGLFDRKNPDVIRVMLPWLENPSWAKDLGGMRNSLVSALSEIEMPESVPGLIAILDEKAVRDDSPDSSDSDFASNVMTVPSNSREPISRSGSVDYGAEETYPFRYQAVNALAKQKSLQAVPALRRILPDVEEWQRDAVVRAILESGGFSIGEQVNALEFVALDLRNQIESNEKMAANFGMPDDGEYEDEGMVANKSRPTTIISTANTMMMDNKMLPPRQNVFNPADIIPILGRQVAAISEPSVELVTAVVSRINYFDNSNPAMADALRKIVQTWNGAAINALMLTDLAGGKADADTIVKLLSLRKELREKQSNDVYAARSGSKPSALGITACILENEGEYAQILASDNAEMKIAMLGCARLIRAKLPVRTVAANLQSPNKTLAKAAELYLESEDSPEAANIIYELYPEKAKILGATVFFAPDNMKFGNFQFLNALFSSVNEKNTLPPYSLYSAISERRVMQTQEKKLQKEILENTELIGIYAYNENFVRIYADKTVFSWAENNARFRERTLNAQEFGYLKNYLASNNVNQLPPFIGDCEGCQPRELLMLGANGGRRVFVKSQTMPTFFAGLDKIFDEMRKPSAKLRYYLENDVAGLEILYAADKLAATTVWKNGADLRLLIEDAERREQIDRELANADEAAYQNADENTDYSKLELESLRRRSQRANDEFAWRNLAGERLGDYPGQPPGFEAIPRRDNMPVPSDNEQWKRRAGNVEIRNGNNELYRISGGQAVKIQTGYYLNPVITADGRWVIAAKYDYDNDRQQLSRINVQTGKETKINVNEAIGSVRPVVFIPSANKVLLVSGGDYDYEYEEQTSAGGTYYLLDAETGAIQPLKGEVRPLIQQTFRPLQTNGKPDEFWAAIPDERREVTQVGVYNAKTFTFTPRLKIPRITFNSMEMWVDEPGNKVYFVYKGQLLALPLVKKEVP